MKREVRTHSVGEFRMSPDDKSINGYAAVFNQLSEDLGGFREKVAPGCFSASVSSGFDVRCLFNHDFNQLLGRISNGTLRLSEDETGLHFEDDPPDTQCGQDVRKLIARRDITQCSFGFSVPPGGDQWDVMPDGSVQRTLLRVDLMDVSPVTFAAYPQTSVDARSLWPDGTPESIVARLAELRNGDEIGAAMQATISRQRGFVQLNQ